VIQSVKLNPKYRLKSDNVERMDLWFVDGQLYEYLFAAGCDPLFCNRTSKGMKSICAESWSVGLAAIIVYTPRTVEAGLLQLRFLRVLMPARYLAFYVQSYSDRFELLIRIVQQQWHYLRNYCASIQVYPAHSGFSLILTRPQPF